MKKTTPQNPKTTSSQQVESSIKDSMDTAVSDGGVKVSCAHVQSSHDGVFFVSSEKGSVKANVAASCLLVPSSGDYVLVSSSDRGEVHILSILKKNKKKNSCINLNADEVSVFGKYFNVTSENSLDLLSKDKINLSAKTGKFNIAVFQWFSNFWQGFFDKFFSHANHSQRVSKFSSETASHYVLNVEGSMQQKAGFIDIKADKSFQLVSDANGVIQTKENLVVPTKQTSFT